MLSVEDGAKVYLYTAVTDMRRGFDRLSQMVQEHIGRNPLQGGIYVLFYSSS